MELLGVEGLATTLGLVVLPFVILWVLVKLLPPSQELAGEGEAAV